MKRINPSMNGAALFSGHNYASYMYQKWQNACRNFSGDMGVLLLLMNYNFKKITYLNYVHLLHIN
jgi:hypothetical protein